MTSAQTLVEIRQSIRDCKCPRKKRTTLLVTVISMEELADAIEDAQYVNAIATQDDGPRPVLPWETPTEEELALWEIGLQEAYQSRNDKGGAPPPFSMEWTCQQHIGFFLFSQFTKEVFHDYPRINFVEEVLRFRKLQGKTARLEKSVAIANDFLGRKGQPQKNVPEEIEEKPVSEDTAVTSDPTITFSWPLPRRTEIDEYDLARGGSDHHMNDSISPRKSQKAALKSCTEGMTKQELEKMYSMNMDYPVCEYSIVGIKGPLQQEILETIDEMADIYKLRKQFSKTDSSVMQEAPPDVNSSKPEGCSSPTTKEAARQARFQAAMDSLTGTSMQNLSNPGSTARVRGQQVGGDTTSLSEHSLSRAAASTTQQKSSRSIGKLELRPDLFDQAEHVVMESLRRSYWDDFLLSEHFLKLKNFLWYQDRRVIPDDFFVMRVLGRGGFGLVTGVLRLGSDCDSFSVVIDSEPCLFFLLFFLSQRARKEHLESFTP